MVHWSWIFHMYSLTEEYLYITYSVSTHTGPPKETVHDAGQISVTIEQPRLEQMEEDSWQYQPRHDKQHMVNFYWK